MSELYYKEEFYKIIGVCMDVHKTLGHGFLEIVYKDAIELEFNSRGIPYSREKSYKIQYKDVILPHLFHADFVVYDSIILEVKAMSGICEDHLTQTLNYLKVSGCKLGLIVNFGQPKLQNQRVVF